MNDNAVNIQRQSFWDFMTNVKFDLFYYDIQYRNSMRLAHILTYAPKIITSIAAAAWMGWNSLSWIIKICPIIIFLMQGIEFLTEYLPYAARMQELRELSNEILPIYREIEKEWRTMNIGSYHFERIPKKICMYTDRIDKVVRHYMKEDALPHTRRAIEKAQKDTERYFSTI